MLLNLPNAFVIEGKAPLENPAALLGVLWPVSVTSVFMAYLWPQWFSTKESWKESVLVCWYEEFCNQNVNAHSYAVLISILNNSVIYFLLVDWGSKSFSFWSHEDRSYNWQELNSFLFLSRAVEKLLKYDLV